MDTDQKEGTGVNLHQYESRTGTTWTPPKVGGERLKIISQSQLWQIFPNPKQCLATESFKIIN